MNEDFKKQKRVKPKFEPIFKIGDIFKIVRTYNHYRSGKDIRVIYIWMVTEIDFQKQRIRALCLYTNDQDYIHRIGKLNPVYTEFDCDLNEINKRFKNGTYTKITGE